MILISLLEIFFGLLMNTAYASIDSVPGSESFSESPQFETPFRARISPEESYRRTQSIFEHFKLSSEELPQLNDLNGAQNLENAKKILPYLDPRSQLSRFSLLSSEKIESFKDRDGQDDLDYALELSTSTNLKSVADFADRLEKIARNSPSDRPLLGLRVALDPGHMGGDFWDKETGKWVVDAHGHKISEGVINLQTCLLLEAQLKKLGAEVMITHRSLAPVTQLPIEKLDMIAYGREELLAESLNPWFLSLLETAPEGASLDHAFESNPNVTKLFTDSKYQRDNYFILHADLDARAQAIDEFHPDVTLIIHYDADVNSVPADGPDGTKAYLPGTFAAEEFATRTDRALFTRHLLDQEAWDASHRLAHFVVNRIHNELGIGFDSASGSNVTGVEPGVIARNLVLTRKLSSHAIAYVECLYYNNPKEFPAILNAPHAMYIDGVNHPYSDRLAEVSVALRDAVVDLVESYKTNRLGLR